MNLDAFGYEVLLQPALYVFALIAVLVTLLKGKDGWKIAEGGWKRAGIALVVAVVILPAIVITPPGHRAAIYTLRGGVSDAERGEGLSFIWPYAQTARMVNVRTQVFKIPRVGCDPNNKLDAPCGVFAQSEDLQEITVHVAVNYHVDPTQAAEIYQDIGLGYEETIIEPAVLQLVKEEVGLILAGDFARNRGPLARAVEVALTTQLTPYGIIVEFVNIEDAVFDPDFIAAVKNKVIADEEAAREQRLIAAERAKKAQTILKAEGEEQRRLIEARGERQAIDEIASALGFTADEYLEWLLINAWSGLLPTTLIGDAGNFGVLLTPQESQE